MLTQLKHDMKPFYGKPLSSDALLGLADMVFFNFPDADMKLDKLGVHFNYEPMRVLVTDLTNRKVRGMKEILDGIQFCCDISDDELNIIGSSVRNMVKHRIDGVKATDRMVNDLSEDYFIIFAILQMKDKTDQILDWIFKRISELESNRDTEQSMRNSPAYITILCNTFRHHLESNKDKPPLVCPPNMKFSKKNLMGLVYKQDVK